MKMSKASAQELLERLQSGPEDRSDEAGKLYHKDAIQLIYDQWYFFAPVAYLGYSEVGRGGLSFDFKSQERSESQPKVHYLPLNELTATYGENPIVETYNPRQEIVVFMRARNGFRIGFNVPAVGSLPTPADLFAAHPPTPVEDGS
jgi:hypothetical protein